MSKNGGKMTIDFYDILNIPKDASQEDIKKSYRVLSKIYHPDLENGDREEFETIKKAYETLSDPEKRKHYDDFGEDKETYDKIINTAMGIFKESTKGSCNDIYSNICLNYERIVMTIDWKISDSQAVIYKIETVLSRIKQAPENDFISLVMNQEKHFHKSQVESYKNDKIMAEAAYDLLNGYSFNVIEGRSIVFGDANMSFNLTGTMGGFS